MLAELVVPGVRFWPHDRSGRACPVARIAAAMAGRCGAGSRLVEVSGCGPLLAGHNRSAKGSGAVEACTQTHGEHARMGSHHQGNQHFGLGEGRHGLFQSRNPPNSSAAAWACQALGVGLSQLDTPSHQLLATVDPHCRPLLCPLQDPC